MNQLSTQLIDVLLLLRGASVKFLPLLRNVSFKLLHFAVFLQEFIQEHRVYGIVAHRVGPPLLIMSD